MLKARGSIRSSPLQGSTVECCRPHMFDGVEKAPFGARGHPSGLRLKLLAVCFLEDFVGGFGQDEQVGAVGPAVDVGADRGGGWGRPPLRAAPRSETAAPLSRFVGRKLWSRCHSSRAAGSGCGTNSRSRAPENAGLNPRYVPAACGRAILRRRWRRRQVTSWSAPLDTWLHDPLRHEVVAHGPALGL